MIKLQNIEVKYNDFTAIKDLTLNIDRGEFFTFLGPSGCGKTTTLRAIAGFVQPSRGSIILNSKDVTLLKPEERNFGIVFQNYALFPHMTVFENIAFGLRVRHEKKQFIADQVKKYATMVGVNDHLQKRVTALSGGQQQRVAIARSIIMEPEILLMDEPLSNLDAKLRTSMRDELKKLQRTLGITTVYVTHDQEEALTISDRIAVFKNGVVEQIGKPEDIYTFPQTESVCCFVGNSNRLTHKIMSHVQEQSPASNFNVNSTSYIRKEKLQLSNDLDLTLTDKILLNGEVTAITYSGMNIVYRVTCLDTNIEIVSLDNQATRFTLNQSVKLIIDPKDIMQFGVEI